MTDQNQDPEVLLTHWVQALEAELDLPVGTVQVMEILDLTRDCAHNVARPAGPVAAYAAGYAQALADVAAGAVAPADDVLDDGESEAHAAPGVALNTGAADAVPRAARLALAWTSTPASTPEAR